jgi:hypothetical protein
LLIKHADKNTLAEFMQEGMLKLMRETIRVKWAILMVMMVTSMGLLCGCVAMVVGGAVAAGAGTVAYVRGELTSQEEVPLDRAWQATEAQIKEMQCTVQEHWKNNLTARMVCHDMANNKIEINLMAAKESFTTFRIRVGTFGDEVYSQEILSKIRKRF